MAKEERIIRRPDLLGNQFAKGNKGGRPLIWTEEKINDEAEFLLEWAQKDESIVLAECYGIRGYSYDHAMEWEKRSNVFAEAKKRAKTIIGARREKGALLGTLDSGIVKCSLGVYDPEHRAYLKEMKSADAQETAAVLNVIVRGLRNDESSKD